MRFSVSRRAVGSVCVGVIVLGCLTGCAGSSRTFGGSGAHGYRLQGKEVVFEFDRGLYESVTLSVDGRWTNLAEHVIEQVAVAGEFNDWDPQAWQMSPVSENRYALRRPLSDFAGRSEWQFKFVVNGDQWVEPTVGSPNRISTGFANQAYNLVLRLSD